MLIKIRFNTEASKSPLEGLPGWRVLYGDHEYLARSVKINTKAWSTCDEISPGVLKWHITMIGTPLWNESKTEVVIADVT